MSAPTLSILVPVFNEGERLDSVVAYLCESPCPIPREWIFIDDCSTDESLLILQDLSSRYGYKVIAMSRNRGKGAAIREGLKAVTGDFVLIQDADFEYDPVDVPRLLAPLMDAQADAVYGSRFRTGSPQVHRTYHYFVNRLLTMLSNLLSGIYLTDMETCYKLLRADLLKAMRLESDRFGIEIEITAYLAKTSARVFELPISYRPRNHLQGKKITWKDGVAALFHLFRFNWGVSFDQAFERLPTSYDPKIGKDYLSSKSIAIASAQRLTPN